jgi:hypothetical protein
MQLLYSTAFSNSSLTFFLPKGSFGGFQIAFRGTNNATPKTRADLGNVQLTWNGNPIVNVDAELLSYLADLKGGFSTFTSTASSTLNAQIYIPAGQFGDTNNSYLITDSDKVYFKLDFPNLSNITGQVYIYGIKKQGVNNYLYCLTSRNVVASGAGTISDVHRLPNVSQIFLKNTGSMTALQIVRDNQTIVDGLKEDVQAFSDFYNQVEASNTVIEIPLNLSRDIREVVSQEILFKYTFSGATTLQQYFGYNILTPNQAVKSVSEIDAEIRKKIELGIIRTADVPKPMPITVSQSFIKTSQSVD